MVLMAAEANAALISSTKLFNDDATDCKIPVDGFNKIIDKVPPRTPSVPSHSKLLTNEVDECKMAAKNSKIHVVGSIIDDVDPTLDGEETNDPLLRVHSSLTRSKQEINKQKTASLAIQNQLNGMTGQLEQILIALSSQPVTDPSVAADEDYNPSDNNKDDDNNANTYNRYFRDEYNTDASLPPNVPRSYKNSAIVLGWGDTSLWKLRSALYLHVTVITVTFHQA